MNHAVQEEQDESLNQLATEIEECTSGEQVQFGEIMDGIAERGYGPLLLVPALVAISPLGGVPGMSIVTGSVIFLVAAQMLLFESHPWIPQRLEEFSFSRQRLTTSVDKARPWLKWVDKLLTERWTLLVQEPTTYVVAILIMVLSLTFYPLALVPFGVFLPGAAITLLALGITARDGVFIVLGAVAATFAIGSLYVLWPF